MNKENLILITLSVKSEEYFSPIQIQKTLFLINEKISKVRDWEIFNFIPYAYGPFDKEIYVFLSNLVKNDYIACAKFNNYFEYKIIEKGLVKIKNLVDSLPPNDYDYIQRIVNFTTTVSFRELVSAIYREYPEMKVNSIFI